MLSPSTLGKMRLAGRKGGGGRSPTRHLLPAHALRRDRTSGTRSPLNSRNKGRSPKGMVVAYTEFLFRDNARTKILAGATALADAVRVTLGPKSRCVLIERKWGSPLVCDDGVTIAKQVKLKDPAENLGAHAV